MYGLKLNTSTLLQYRKRSNYEECSLLVDLIVWPSLLSLKFHSLSIVKNLSSANCDAVGLSLGSALKQAFLNAIAS